MSVFFKDAEGDTKEWIMVYICVHLSPSSLELVESAFRVDVELTVMAASRCSRHCGCCCGCLLLLLPPLPPVAPHSISLPWGWLFPWWCPCVCQESLHADLVAASGLIACLQRDRVSAGMCHDVCQQGIEVDSGHRAQQEMCAVALCCQ